MKLQKDLETARSDPKQRKLNFGTGIGTQQLEPMAISGSGQSAVDLHVDLAFQLPVETG